MRALGIPRGPRPSRAIADCSDRDPGGYIVCFIEEFFPAKHQFKLIAKILADGMRHELVHGFGGRSTTAPFELGVYISDDPSRFNEVRTGKQRPVLAVNAVAFADAVLAAFTQLQKRVERDADLANAVVENAAVPFKTPSGVLAEWNNRVLKRSLKAPV